MAKRTDTTDYVTVDKIRKAGLANPKLFIQKHLHINDKFGRRIQLQFTASQARVAEVRYQHLKDGKPCWLLILKGRQRGVSTVTQGMVFAETYCGENTNALVMTHLKEVTTELLDKAKLFYKCLPDYAKMPLAKANEYELRWDHNDSKLTLATAGTADITHGRTLRKLHLSEISRYPDLYQLIKGLKAVPEAPDTLVVAESTAHGADNMMCDLWEEAVKGGNRWTPLFLNWMDDEDCVRVFSSDREKDALLERIFSEYPRLRERMDAFNCTPGQIAWYYQQLVDSLGDEAYTAQEFPMTPSEAFIAAGTPFFPRDITYQYRLLSESRQGNLYDPRIPFASWNDLQHNCKAPDLVRERDTYLEIWVPPVAGVRYIVVADSAEGIQGRDPCSAFVLDMVTQNIVAELHGIIEPHPMKDMCIALARLYNQAIIVPEAHGAGTALCALLRESGYQPLYYKRKMLNGVPQVTNEVGWDTNPGTRPALFAEMLKIYRARRGDKHFIPSTALLDEIKFFVVQSMTGAGRADKGKHDDRVMAWAIGVYVCLQYLGMQGTGVSTVGHSIGRQGGVPVNPTPQQTLEMIMDNGWTGQSFEEFYGNGTQQIIYRE